MDIRLKNSRAKDSTSADAVENRMKIAVRDIGIPPRPTILTQIEAEASKDEPDFIYLAKLLSHDVGLSAGMIKVANSPFFSFGKKVPTIQEALLVLGLKLVVKTVAGLALQQAFKHVPNMERFWDASAATAEISGMLAKQIGRGSGVRPEDAYTFALFRDCGIPMLMIPFPEYRQILAQANTEPEQAFTDIEDQAIGLNHAIVGTELAEDWLLPQETCQAIRYHHDIAALDGSVDIPPRARFLIAIAQLAEYLIQQKTGQSQTSEWQKLGAECLACLDISPDDLPELAATCMPEISD
jgi:HD-like signal output (HDOD) protein